MFTNEFDLKDVFAEVMQHFYEQHIRIFLVIARHSEAVIPETAFRNGSATLNVGANAIHNPSYESDHFRFGIRHNGKTHICKVPYEAIAGIYCPDVIGAPAVQFALLTMFHKQFVELGRYAEAPMEYLQALQDNAVTEAVGNPLSAVREDAPIRDPAAIEQQEQSVALEAPEPRQFDVVTSMDSFRARRARKP